MFNVSPNEFSKHFLASLMEKLMFEQKFTLLHICKITPTDPIVNITNFHEGISFSVFPQSLFEKLEMLFN